MQRIDINKHIFALYDLFDTFDLEELYNKEEEIINKRAEIKIIIQEIIEFLEERIKKNEIEEVKDITHTNRRLMNTIWIVLRKHLSGEEKEEYDLLFRQLYTLLSYKFAYKMAYEFYWKHRYTSALITLNEVTAVAIEGLIEALEKYEPEQGTMVTTYAFYTIRRYLQLFYSKSMHALSIATTFVEQYNSLSEEKKKYLHNMRTFYLEEYTGNNDDKNENNGTTFIPLNMYHTNEVEDYYLNKEFVLSLLKKYEYLCPRRRRLITYIMFQKNPLFVDVLKQEYNSTYAYKFYDTPGVLKLSKTLVMYARIKSDRRALSDISYKEMLNIKQRRLFEVMDSAKKEIEKEKKKKRKKEKKKKKDKEQQSARKLFY